MEFRQHKQTDDKKPTRYYSKKQENNVAKALGARTTPNSGATPYKKGDVDDDLFLVECKTQTTDKKTMTIHKEWFDKNLSESIFMKKPYNCVVFNFGPSGKNYYAVDEQTFLEMKEALEEKLRNS